MLIFSSRCRSWYAYVIELCVITVESAVEATFLLIFFHICFIFLIWSYFKTIFTPVATVPASFRLQKDELEQLYRIKNVDEQTRLLKHLAADLPLLNMTLSNCVRFCGNCFIFPSSSFSFRVPIYMLVFHSVFLEKCAHIKPDRAHHCSVCSE